MRIIKLLILSVLFLPACSHERIRFIPIEVNEAGKSIIYIYRQNSSSNIIVSPDILVDGKKQSLIKNNSYIHFFLPAGQHNIKLALNDRYEGQKELDVFIDEGHAYFFEITTKMQFRMNQPYLRRFDFYQVDKALALNEMQGIPSMKKKTKTKKYFFKDSVSEDKKEDASFSTQKTRSPFSN